MDTNHKEQLTASQKIAFTVEPLKDLTATGNITAGGNITAQGKLQEQGHDLLPPGSIIMWSGDINAIPPGWALCDGGTYTDSQGKSIQTPPLQNRFIVAADTQGEYGQGRAGDYKIDLPEQIFHTEQGGKHTHKFPSYWYDRLVDSGGDDTVIDRDAKSIKDATTQESGQHRHDVKIHISHEGGNSPGEIRPRWYALALIMKL